MPDLAPWQWALGAFSAFMIGVAKTGAPGVGTMIVPFMVMAVGDARHAAAWTVPLLITGDIFAIFYWWKHAEAKRLFSLIPWVVAGMIGGGLALAMSEPVLRRMIGAIVLFMVALYLWRKRNPQRKLYGASAVYGIAAGFSTTVANAAGPVMNMYLLTQNLPKEQFVATGARFFFVVNVAKIPIYVYHDLFSRQSLIFDVLMVPAAIGGAYAGLWFIRRIPQGVFDTLIVVMTAVSAVLLFR